MVWKEEEMLRRNENEQVIVSVLCARNYHSSLHLLKFYLAMSLRCRRNARCWFPLLTCHEAWGGSRVTHFCAGARSKATFEVWPPREWDQARSGGETQFVPCCSFIDVTGSYTRWLEILGLTDFAWLTGIRRKQLVLIPVFTLVSL